LILKKYRSANYNHICLLAFNGKPDRSQVLLWVKPCMKNKNIERIYSYMADIDKL